MTNEQLVACIQSGEDVAENMAALYGQMSGLIAKMAWRYRGQEELEDLKQEGYIGLCDAVRAYRPEKEIPFHQYALFWIRQNMKRYIDNCGSLVRIPVERRALLRSYHKLQSDFRMEIGRVPSDQEVMYYLGLSPERLERLKTDMLMEHQGSIDVPVEEDGETTIGELQAGCEGFEDEVVEEITREEMKAALWGCVDELEERKRYAVLCRYKEGCTLKETGERLGVGIEGARQWVNKGLRELRKPSRADRLRLYLDEYAYAAGIKRTGIKSFRNSFTSATEMAALKLMELEAGD